ncbi:XRE family transcriptional regulator [Flavobacterium sp. WLB]|uniref:helix-turn-helix domain-containing protein n=1 Tax=unclassified Flavobacterium TaxID=196869 RepID=UPI0006ABA502|nr:MULTISPECIES: helix-turn-helix transcriptional regulator [unclassified Flavobacterium]KOP37672.1 hypothetical protein AKO67_13510 [Flavobacterium sp. VMW]OWU91153.1 hypothetical protein APR43_09375 [Flavobacterium sp. NLM]PUU70163.1 XRE family transcriptional regulator [Flavobacterium sp. WLB]
MNLNEKVKAIRENQKISQSYIAHELGLDQSQYSRREKGQIQFTANEILRLAHLLETPISYLFGEQEEISFVQEIKNKADITISEKLIEQYEIRLKEKDKLIETLNKKLKSKK